MAEIFYIFPSIKQDKKITNNCIDSEWKMLLLSLQTGVKVTFFKTIMPKMKFILMRL